MSTMMNHNETLTLIKQNIKKLHNINSLIEENKFLKNFIHRFKYFLRNRCRFYPIGYNYKTINKLYLINSNDMIMNIIY